MSTFKVIECLNVIITVESHLPLFNTFSQVESMRLGIILQGCKVLVSDLLK